MKSIKLILNWSQIPALGIALAFAAGCGGGGGGSGPTAAQNPDPVTIDSLQTGTPLCSTAGNGQLDGPVTDGITASVTISSLCSDPSASTCVWLGLNSGDTNITHYDWEIVGWKNEPPHGGLDKYGEVIDIDPVNGKYIVRTYEAKVRYLSAVSSLLASLTEPFSQQISVTAWTADGRFGTASFTVVVQPGGAAVSSVYGSLASTDAASHGRAGHYSDFYRLTGASGSTTLKVEGFDTYLYVYSSSLSRIAEKDEGANNGGSQLTLNLQNGQTYYIEVTSFAPGQTGHYLLSSTSGGLSTASDPWANANVPNIAGTYTVSEDTTITLVYDGITTVTNAVATTTATVTQSGPSFRFQASDPSGTLPPTTRYGNINGNSLSLSGEPFIPANPAIDVTSNTQTSSGTVGANQFTITTTSQLQGTYKGLPVTAQVDSTATFTR